MTDLLDRLAAANPVTIEAATEDVAALPNNMPFAEPRRSRRLIVVPVAALALTVAAVLFALPRTSDPRDYSAQAAARALSNGGRILHSVMVIRQPDAIGGVKRSEIWIAADGSSSRIRTTTPDGRVLQDIATTAVSDDSGTFDPIATTRAQLEDGSLVLLGTTELNGRHVVKYVYRNDVSQAVFLDADTLEPVQVRAVVNGSAVTTDYERFERLDDSANNREILTPTTPVEPRPPVISRKSAR